MKKYDICSDDEKKLAWVQSVIQDLLDENKVNLAELDGDYNAGYAEGYHDALVDVLKRLNIDTKEKYFN